jgi:hypothetical protein
MKDLLYCEVFILFLHMPSEKSVLVLYIQGVVKGLPILCFM